MQLPLSWLKEILPIDLSPQQIGETLTLAGLEVDKIETEELPFAGIIVAKVASTSPHPNAERLCIATVWNGKEELQIVCGASNCRGGITVALAPIGASLKDEQGKAWKIKKSKLRDVESFGMLCSAKELGFAKEAEGIIELDDSLVAGTDLASLYTDPVLEISLTPNLGHCQCVVGVARELAAMLDMKIKPVSGEVEKESSANIEDHVAVEVQDKVQCPRYACRLIQGVKVGPSPEWLTRRLEASGVRAINNIVDATNYVMLEMGQPMHAFDYDKISGGKIVVSSHAPYKKLRTLDDVERDIPPGTLLICDEEKPLAIAGVMGGAESAVTDETCNILLEAACFSPQAIRKTSKVLGLRTDSSQRFEKGIDGGAVAVALGRAAELIRNIAGGHPAKGAIDRKAHAFAPRLLTCRVSRVNQILGTALSRNEVVDCFRRLEMAVEKADPNLLLVLIPTYRNDLQIEIDLVEEAARVYGYNNLPKPRPRYASSTLSNAPMYTFETAVRRKLIGEGLQECLTCDLISPALAALSVEHGMDEKALISVLHPSSVDQSVLRASLLPGLLQTIKYNLDHQNDSFSGFEVGRIHFKEKDQVKEYPMASIILTGKERPYHWDPKSREADFFDLKGIVENLLESIGVAEAEFEPSHLRSFHPGRQARVKVDGAYVGVLGEVHPSHLQALGIGQRVLFAELNLPDLYQLKKKEWLFTEYSLFPGSERDWTVTLKDEAPISKIVDAIESVGSPLLEKIMLLDLYKSEQIGKDRKNATFRFRYRDAMKTIAIEAVEREHAKILQTVAEKLRDSIH